jgi:hypothetical protein
MAAYDIAKAALEKAKEKKAERLQGTHQHGANLRRRS